MKTTPVTNHDRVTRYATLPDGYSRVWSGLIFVGDLYLNWQRFWNDGVTEWVPFTFDKCVKGCEWENNAAWFGCLIREKPYEIGYPCIVCQVRPPMEDCDFCDNCVGNFYPAEVEE